MLNCFNCPKDNTKCSIVSTHFDCKHIFNCLKRIPNVVQLFQRVSSSISLFNCFNVFQIWQASGTGTEVEGWPILIIITTITLRIIITIILIILTRNDNTNNNNNIINNNTDKK